MTSTDFANSKYRPMAFSMPFGANDSSNYMMPKTAQDPTNPNFLDGFPVAFSAPKSNNGQYVTRLQMNGIGNLASRFEFFRRVGGIVTFDSDLATAIGGYPSGAVLKYLNNGYLYDVISLVDNNMVDFNSVGIDDVNWAYLSVSDKQVFGDIFFEGGNGLSVGTTLLAVIKAKKTAPIRLESSISATVGGQVSTYPYTETFVDTLVIFAGCGIMIKDLGTSIPSTIPMPNFSTWNDWLSLSGSYTSLWSNGSGILHVSEQQTAGFLPEVTKDHYYALALFCGEGAWSNDAENNVVTINKYTSLSGSIKITY